MSLSPTIVVVEDDVEMNALERELLVAHGFQAIPAYTGKEALEVCRQSRPDAVLLDVMLPEMDGFEACCHLRAESTIPIVMLTALREIAYRDRSVECGADAYFTKPFDPAEVVTTLRELIAKRQ